MIGYYNYTVILTYMSAICAFLGMTQTAQGNVKIALYCLMACGMFDLFDGKVARTKKNRTDGEKVFGIQIDSLCDVLCFGMFPAMINYHICDSKFKLLAMLGSAMLVVGAVIRLGYFNVMEQERQQHTDANRVTYQGLPVTSDALIIPLAYLLKTIADRHMVSNVTCVLFCLLIILIAILFVLDIDIKKPQGKGIILLGLIALCIIYGLVIV